MGRENVKQTSTDLNQDELCENYFVCKITVSIISIFCYIIETVLLLCIRKTDTECLKMTTIAVIWTETVRSGDHQTIIFVKKSYNIWFLYPHLLIVMQESRNIKWGQFYGMNGPFLSVHKSEFLQLRNVFC